MVCQVGGIEALVRTVMQAGDREDITEPAVSVFCVWVFLFVSLLDDMVFGIHIFGPLPTPCFVVIYFVRVWKSFHRWCYSGMYLELGHYQYVAGCDKSLCANNSRKSLDIFAWS